MEIGDVVNAICYDPATTEADRLELVGRIPSAGGLMTLLRAYNWDDGFDIPKAIALHPAADLAVALNLYWLANAHEWYGVSEPPEDEHEIENHAFGQLLTERILAGSYAVGEASFDPGFNRVDLYRFSKGELPEVFYTPVVGDAGAP